VDGSAGENQVRRSGESGVIPTKKETCGKLLVTQLETTLTVLAYFAQMGLDVFRTAPCSFRSETHARCNGTTLPELHLSHIKSRRNLSRKRILPGEEYEPAGVEGGPIKRRPSLWLAFLLPTADSMTKLVFKQLLWL